MEKTEKYAAILCGGSGSRAGLGYNKAFFNMGEKTMLEVVLDKFSDFDKIVIAAAENDLERVQKIAKGYGASVVRAGKTRFESAKAAITYLHKNEKSGAVVAIHDAARPYVSQALIEKTVQSAIEFGSGAAAVRVLDSLKRAQNGVVQEGVSRKDMYAMQTPQAFNLSQIALAYERAEAKRIEDFTDDGEVFCWAGHSLRLVDGEYSNKKMTVLEDFCSLNHQNIGIGFDVHRLVRRRKLILGGVEIPFKKGLLGHSDADVLLHSIADALLSAAGAPDIGVIFPSDLSNKNLDSAVILQTAHKMLTDSGQRIDSISAVIVAQKPKLSKYIGQMRLSIAQILTVSPQLINISATTTERLGIVGKSRAIAAHATCLTSCLQG